MPWGAFSLVNEVEIELPADATSRKRVFTSVVLFRHARRRTSYACAENAYSGSEPDLA